MGGRGGGNSLLERTVPMTKLIDSGGLTNLTSKQTSYQTTYFQAYQKSFQEGEYNLSEPVYTPTGQVIRRYMSGGMVISPDPKKMDILKINRPAMVDDKGKVLLNDQLKIQKSIVEFSTESTEQKTAASALLEVSKLDQVITADWGKPTNPYAGKVFPNEVEKILAHPDFTNEDPRVIESMRAFYDAGELAGTGQLAILPVDQGLEHSTARSHFSNPPGADPFWQVELAYS